MNAVQPYAGSGGPFAISLWFQLSPDFNVSDSDCSAMFLFSHVPSQLALDLGAMSKVLTNRTLREAPAAPATTANNASTVAAHVNNVTTSSLIVKKHTRRDVSGIHTGDDRQEGLASSQVQVGVNPEMHARHSYSVCSWHQHGQLMCG